MSSGAEITFIWQAAAMYHAYYTSGWLSGRAEACKHCLRRCFSKWGQGAAQRCCGGIATSIFLFSLALHAVKQRERHAVFQITQFTRFSHSWVVLRWRKFEKEKKKGLNLRPCMWRCFRICPFRRRVNTHKCILWHSEADDHSLPLSKAFSMWVRCKECRSYETLEIQLWLIFLPHYFKITPPDSSSLHFLLLHFTS